MRIKKKKKNLSECKDGKRKRNGGQSATHIPTESLKRASLASTWEAWLLTLLVKLKMTILNLVVVMFQK